MLTCTDCKSVFEYTSDLSFCPHCGGDNLLDIDD